LIRVVGHARAAGRGEVLSGSFSPPHLGEGPRERADVADRKTATGGRLFLRALMDSPTTVAI
jgi:hypothetical protein